jgi:hypothetical protein
MANHTNNRGHRRKIEINFKELEKLCYMQCSEQEIAQWFHCGISTVAVRVKEQFGISFQEYFERHRIGGLISLRRNMFKMSENSPQMAIFLAKNWLSMSDRQEMEYSTKENKPIKIVVVSERGKELTKKLVNGN